jgi:cyclopropane fatty-acyl-phospholipid synthase-like methyltransferase
MPIDACDIHKTMQETYDHYFASDGYRQRYPQPNAATMAFLMRHGIAQAKHILDFGCGNGRYSFALLEQSQASLTAYDISEHSLAEFAQRLAGTPYGERVTFAHGDVRDLGEQARYDVVLLLFGVLSHVGAKQQRLATLRLLHSTMPAEGRLMLSVPSIWRRRPWDLFKFALARRLGYARAPQDEAGNIYFRRRIAGRFLTFFYHLYSLRSLRAELAQAGFWVCDCEPESVLPEWWVTQSAWLGRLDRWLCAWVPAGFGYGIRVLAVPA